jgi:DNA-binding transcriptional LysR family regulator
MALPSLVAASDGRQAGATAPAAAPPMSSIARRRLIFHSQLMEQGWGFSAIMAIGIGVKITISFSDICFRDRYGPMYDPFTMDQLRALLLVADEGSFSAAARRLDRVQSAVSQSMGVLEEHLGVTLWDRSAKVPRPTAAGQAVLAASRRVCAEADALRRLVDGLKAGLEASVHLCVDALFPLSALAALCAAFAREFPTVDLRVDTQTMSAVSERVLGGAATLGVVSPMGLQRGLESRRLAAIRMVPVVARHHPLATVRGLVRRARLEDEVQIVLTERGVEGVPDQAVLSARTWRIADLHTKRELLLAGLGWGNLPEHLARQDLRSGRLVKIRPEAWNEGEHTLTLFAVHRTNARIGPAHGWLLSNLGKLCARELAPARANERRRKRRAFPSSTGRAMTRA